MEIPKIEQRDFIGKDIKSVDFYNSEIFGIQFDSDTSTCKLMIDYTVETIYKNDNLLEKEAIWMMPSILIVNDVFDMSFVFKNEDRFLNLLIDKISLVETQPVNKMAKGPFYNFKILFIFETNLLEFSNINKMKFHLLGDPINFRSHEEYKKARNKVLKENFDFLY